jgi:hypothetical protein
MLVDDYVLVLYMRLVRRGRGTVLDNVTVLVNHYVLMLECVLIDRKRGWPVLDHVTVTVYDYVAVFDSVVWIDHYVVRLVGVSVPSRNGARL